MTTERQRTCAERIDEQRDRLIENLGPLTRASYAGEDLPLSDLRYLKRYEQIDLREDIAEQARERLWETPLAVSVTRVVRVDLSTGGPGSWLEAHVDDDGDVLRIEYHFNDWFDHASVSLYGDDYTVAESFIQAVASGVLEQ